MPDAQTIYEFRLACHKPGCPICTLVQRAGARYIEGIFSESLLDPDARKKLVESTGFCYQHSWLSINLKLSDALGHAILYKDLVGNAINTIEENGKNGGLQLSNSLDTEIPCPACLIEETTTVRIIDSVKLALGDRGFVDEYKQSNGLCIPHLRRILQSIDWKKKEIVLDHQRTCMESLKGELADFIRKSDYRFREEAIGKEGDSYKRAADMIKGKHQPIDKKDLG